MQNPAYSLAALSVIGGLVLLMIADQGAGLYTPLGTALLVVAIVLVGIGKLIDLLGYVQEGASDPESGK